MPKLKRKRNKSLPENSSFSPEAQELAALLHKHIPPFVVERLRPMKEKLRNQMAGLSEEERESLRSEMAALSFFNKEEYETWGVAFMQMFEPNGVQMPMGLASFPKPPKEPSGAWEELSGKAKLLGMEGVAASLMLHTVACARAWREYVSRQIVG
jgi:hypothetical protein